MRWQALDKLKEAMKDNASGAAAVHDCLLEAMKTVKAGGTWDPATNSLRAPPGPPI